MIQLNANQKSIWSNITIYHSYFNGCGCPGNIAHLTMTDIKIDCGNTNPTEPRRKKSGRIALRTFVSITIACDNITQTQRKPIWPTMARYQSWLYQFDGCWCRGKLAHLAFIGINVGCHNGDVIMGAMASQITNLTIVYPFIQAQIRENTKAPRHWPLWGEFTGDRWIPRTNGR